MRPNRRKPIVQVKAVDAGTLPGAKALVDRVFPHQTPAERLFFWVWPRRMTKLGRALLALARVAELTEVWVAVDDDGAVLGTTGLYRYRKDADEAFWLTWFCVAPESRGAGVGAQLLDFSIAQARQRGAHFLRLYTSDDPNEAVAQNLYESRGLQVYETRNRILYRELRRELRLV
jgi:GNAT superfamily N-acetyltransferase